MIVLKQIAMCIICMNSRDETPRVSIRYIIRSDPIHQGRTSGVRICSVRVRTILYVNPSAGQDDEEPLLTRTSLYYLDL